MLSVVPACPTGLHPTTTPWSFPRHRGTGAQCQTTARRGSLQPPVQAQLLQGCRAAKAVPTPSPRTALYLPISAPCLAPRATRMFINKSVQEFRVANHDLQPTCPGKHCCFVCLRFKTETKYQTWVSAGRADNLQDPPQEPAHRASPAQEARLPAEEPQAACSLGLISKLHTLDGLQGPQRPLRSQGFCWRLGLDKLLPHSLRPTPPRRWPPVTRALTSDLPRRELQG